MCWDYVPLFKEIPLGHEVVGQNISSQSKEGHWDGKKMLGHAQ
jgi:hypothetical protein